MLFQIKIKMAKISSVIHGLQHNLKKETACKNIKVADHDRDYLVNFLVCIQNCYSNSTQTDK